MSFQFRQFSVNDSHCAMKVGTDGVLLGAWADVEGASSIVDLGAGSGLLSLMVAQRNPNAFITAVEIDADAATDCGFNFAKSPWSARLEVLLADALDFKPPSPVDLILSNPPFFSEPLHSPLATRALARHSDRLSPVSVLRWASLNLSASGSVALILPSANADDLIYHAEVLHLKERRRLDVVSRHDRRAERTLLQFSRIDGCPLRDTLIIRGADGQLTPEYIRLTSSFYLNIAPDYK